jgi:hypothetical protein
VNRHLETVGVSGSGEDEWLRPIDPMVDSDAPEQIAFELGRRHALYLREAQRLVLDGLVPDEHGLAEGIRAETRRYLGAHPWLAGAALERAVAQTEDTTLAALREIMASAPSAAPAAATQPEQTVRRLALQPSATIVGNMAVRKTATGEGVELSWDAAASVTEWTLRVSVRPDPRQDYVEGEVMTLPRGSTSSGVELDEHPRRIHLYGHARDGRIVRRVVISALTSGNSGAQWKRQATAS